MSKIKIEFKIPEESEQAEITLAASQMHSVIWDVLRDIRSQLRQNERHIDRTAGAEWVRQLIVDKLENEGISNLF